MRTRAVQLALIAAAGIAIFVLPAFATSKTTGPPTTGGGTPPLGVPNCAASQLTASYTMVPGSNATGRVEYLLSVTNRSASASCLLVARLPLTLLGNSGQKLPTHASYASGGPNSIVLAKGQFAQAMSQFSPDFPGPREPKHGNCEPTSHALRINVAGSTLRAPMDPTPVCDHGAISFRQLTLITVTTRCAPTSLTAAFRRVEPPFAGFASYDLTLRNHTGRACYADSVEGLRLIGAGGRKLATRVHGQVQAPYVFPAHKVQTAIAMVAIKRKHGSGRCDPLATHVSVSIARGAAAIRTSMHPKVQVCRGGLINLSALFVNG